MLTRNRLQTIRERRGIPAAQLARDVGVSRPTIYAIEAGTYTPNTTVALKLARALECTVEDLFSLEDEEPAAQRPVRVRLISDDPGLQAGQPLQLCRVGAGFVGISAPHRDGHVSDADGIVSRMDSNRSGALVRPLDDPDYTKRILVGGCDPATPILAAQLNRLGFEIISATCPSRCALERLKAGLVHIAGCHLRDAKTGDYNLPFVERMFPKGDVRIVSYVTWEQGIVVQRGNPKAIRSIRDLARKNVRLVNREKGSGARELLDRALQDEGLDARRVLGYGVTARGHIPAARAVSSSEADCCIATRSAALHFGLGFIPLASERYDFVVLRKYWDLPPVKAFFDELSRTKFRRRLEAVTSYDAARAGEVRV